MHPHNFKNIIDFAFLCLHGTKGEDGAIQGLLEWCNIPYSGTHILGSAINIDKGIQKKLICQSLINDDIPDNLLKYELLPFNNWQSLKDKNFLYNKLKKKLGLPFVVKSCRQGSSIGVKIIRSEEDFEILVNSCFFITKIDSSYWNTLEVSAKINFISTKIIDIRYGIGMPLYVTNNALNNDLISSFEAKPKQNTIKQPGLPRIIYKNLELINFLDSYFKSNDGHLFLTSKNFEKEVLFEPFIEGREFSCIMIEDKEGAPLVLPPTELISLDNNLKSSSNPSFDYRAKYLPGITSKSTPMDISYIQFFENC